jgi:short-subunit dehydrogenase
MSRISDSVVVITGASSGIGRATAEAFAGRGATLVLAARRRWALEEVARQCQVLGGRTLVVPADVLDEPQVQHLARRAIETFGRIDGWVNNAAVSLFGRFEECPPEVYRRVIETNLFGYIHGARAVMPYFREQGRGVLINVSSVVSTMPQPYTSAYVASKAAIRSFSDCLRMELHLDRAHGIHVCTVLPATIDTPLFQNAANYTGRAVQAMPPVIRAERVARTIVKLYRSPRREAVVGIAGRLVMFEAAFLPALYQRNGARMVDRRHLQDTPADPAPGNVFEPSERTSIDGNWQSPAARYTPPALATLAAAALGALGYWLFSDGTPTRRMKRARGWVAPRGRAGLVGRRRAG